MSLLIAGKHSYGKPRILWENSKAKLIIGMIVFVPRTFRPLTSK